METLRRSECGGGESGGSAWCEEEGGLHSLPSFLSTKGGEGVKLFGGGGGGGVFGCLL